MWKDKMFYLMLLPGIVYFIIFHYVPMYGVQIAFRNYKMKLGFFGSPWVGLDNFEKLFRDPGFLTALNNTIIISLLKIAIGFPAPILLALMLNAVRSTGLRRIFQSISYLPHFLSWIVIASLVRSMFSTSMGSV
ncbi:MAG: sugar ABC transporter permease, partial [Candidatus Fimadaptatus sp.]